MYLLRFVDETLSNAIGHEPFSSNDVYVKYNEDGPMALECCGEKHMIWLPLFLSNPNLWKILIHIGDSTSWKSLKELLDYLVDTSDVSYRDTMKQCRIIHKAYFQY